MTSQTSSPPVADQVPSGPRDRGPRMNVFEGNVVWKGKGDSLNRGFWQLAAGSIRARSGLPRFVVEGSWSQTK